ncbi:MBL fold metallo-hydrolase [Chromobacterium aquaticum]|uniref:MBL fold metallo-hydrolase n=2 Tax=Chromobacterium aquaticum TaxID=467180 RepID=A0ABV8ZVI7_9NEIS
MFRPTLIAGALALSAAASHAAEPLQLSIYNADGNSFNVSSVLVSGAKDAILIDTGFTRADAYRIAAKVLDSGKQLKAIYISQADPDYYFGAAELKKIFPRAAVLSNGPTLAKIKANIQGKQAYWGPKMGDNAPTTALLPEELKGDRLELEGQALEIKGTRGVLAHRGYVWIPSIRAIVGNVGVTGASMHVWTADTQSKAERQAWIKQLDEMEALKPATVVPGHMQAGDKTDLSAVRFTRLYLQRFEANLATSANSGELIAAMKREFPQAGEDMSLDIGAKVNKGEMKW